MSALDTNSLVGLFYHRPLSSDSTLSLIINFFIIIHEVITSILHIIVVINIYNIYNIQCFNLVPLLWILCNVHFNSALDCGRTQCQGMPYTRLCSSLNANPILTFWFTKGPC